MKRRAQHEKRREAEGCECGEQLMAVLGAACMGQLMKNGDGGLWVAQGGQTHGQGGPTALLRIDDPWLAWPMCLERRLLVDGRQKWGEQGQIACQCMLFCQLPFGDVLQSLQSHQRQ